MKIKYLPLTFLTSLMVLSACNREHTPVVIHIFRDQDGAIGKNINEAISNIGLQQLKTSDGSPVMIATYEFRNYREALATLGVKNHPDIVIFNSRSDWLASHFEAPPSALHCAPHVTCLAEIPAWTSGKDREASELVLKMLDDRLGKFADGGNVTPR